MKSLGSFVSGCGECIREFYEISLQSIGKDLSSFDDAIRGRGAKFVNNHLFLGSPELHTSRMRLLHAIFKWLGPELASIKDVGEIVYSAHIPGLEVPENASEAAYTSELYRLLCELEAGGFNYVGPCSIFDFADGVNELRSEYVSIVPARRFFDLESFPRGGKNWSVEVGDSFDDEMSDGLKFKLAGNCWIIKSKSPESTARREASWLAGVFTSAFRVGLTPADYCHRPRIGMIEANIFSELLYRDKGYIYNDSKFGSFGRYRHNTYKIDQKVVEEFNSGKFQGILSGLLSPPKNSLFERVASGLGWLTRGRQASDPSERLLLHFTSLEALLSHQGVYDPVSETICRYVSVIAARDIASRPLVYEDMKPLYSIRSSIVHRGSRSANEITANNIQSIAEVCFSEVVSKVDLSMRHVDFIKDLKSSSHGLEWPLPSKAV